MLIIQVIFWIVLLLWALFTGLAFTGRPLWWALAALAAWVASFFMGFSIGLGTLVVAYAQGAVALTRFAGLRRWQFGLASALAGILLWWLAVNCIDDYYLFWPIGLLF